MSFNAPFLRPLGWKGTFLLLSILWVQLSQAQRELRLKLRDSVILDCPEAGTFKGMAGYSAPVLLKNGKFYVYEIGYQNLHIFSKDGNCERHYQVSKGGRPFKAMAFDIGKKAHYFSYFKTFAWNDPDGTPLGSEFLGWGSDAFSFSQRLYSYPHLRVDEERDRLILPVKASVEGEASRNSYKVDSGYYRIYDEYGLLAVYPLSDLDGKKGGTPERYIGSMDPVYKKKPYLPHLDHFFWHMDRSKGHFYIGQMASPRIRVYDKDGKTLRVFGKKGEHLTKRDSLHRIRHLPESSRALGKKERKLQVLSPSYTRVYYDTIHQLTFRTYKRFSDRKKEELLQKAFSRHEWYRAQMRKPPFLQVYDRRNDDRLIMDRPMQRTPFRLVGVTDHTLYVNGGKASSSEGEGIKIYRYGLKVK